jgi:Na+-driven multidrug efflux pump
VHGATLLRILAPGIIPYGITTIYLTIKRVEKKLKMIMGLTAFSALVTIGLSYGLLPVMGISGVGVAWLGAQSITAITIMLIWYNERRRLKPDNSNHK